MPAEWELARQPVPLRIGADAGHLVCARVVLPPVANGTCFVDLAAEKEAVLGRHLVGELQREPRLVSLRQGRDRADGPALDDLLDEQPGRLNVERQHLLM
jgi:hypothetical protein